MRPVCLCIISGKLFEGSFKTQWRNATNVTMHSLGQKPKFGAYFPRGLSFLYLLYLWSHTWSTLLLVAWWLVVLLEFSLVFGLSGEEVGWCLCHPRGWQGSCRPPLQAAWVWLAQAEAHPQVVCLHQASSSSVPHSKSMTILMQQQASNWFWLNEETNTIKFL